MMKDEQRRWGLANALVTALADRREADEEIRAIAAALAKECGFVLPVDESVTT